MLGMVHHTAFRSVKGPFNLRSASRPVALIASLYVGFLVIDFCLPTLNPVTSQTLNYAPVAVGIVIAWILGTWLLFARKTFHGPRRQIELGEKMGLSPEDPRVLAEKDKLEA